MSKFDSDYKDMVNALSGILRATVRPDSIETVQEAARIVLEASVLKGGNEERKRIVEAVMAVLQSGEFIGLEDGVNLLRGIKSEFKKRGMLHAETDPVLSNS